MQQVGGSSASIDDAVRRRDELLQSQEAASPAAPQTSDSASTTPAEATTGPTETTGTPSSPLAPKTASQQIAQQVLSHSTASAAGVPPNPPLKAPFGESGPQDPIQVTIIERVYPLSPGMTFVLTPC